MNKLYSMGAAIATMLLLSLSADSMIVSSFSDSLSSQTNDSAIISTDEGHDTTLSTADPANDLADSPVSNTVVLSGDPVSSNAQDEPAISNVELDASSDDTNTVSQPSEPGVNGNGSSSPSSSSETGAGSPGSPNGVSGDVGAGGFGVGDPSTANSQASSSQSNDSSTQTSPSPTQSPSSDGSAGSLPSNGTSGEVGSGNSDQVSGESSSNQSAVETTSSGSAAGNVSSTESPAPASSANNATSLDSNSGSGSLFDQLQAVGPFDEASLEAASSSDPNSVSQPISSGDGQVINFGDVSNTQNVSAGVSFDKNSYSIGDTVQVTVQDGDGNIDPDTVNTVQVVIRSQSDQSGITVTLTETGPNTGQFVGTFQLTDSASTSDSIKVDPSKGDNIQLLYDGSHPRAKATLNGVSQPGTVQIKQVAILSDDAPDILVGNAVELILGDGAQLAPNEATDFCLSFAQPVETCGGSINLTMSYANAPLNKQQPEFLTIFQKVGTEWINLKEFVPITVDESTKTVTAVNMPFGPGIFTIGAAAGLGGGGGGGGGIGLPGAGIVLDFLAPVTASSPPPPSPSPPPPTTTSPSPAAEDTTASTGTSDETNSTGPDSAAGNTITPSSSTSAGLASGSQEDNSEARTGNITIVVPGEGNITLAYQSLLSEGNLTVTPVTSPSEIAAIKIEKETADMQGSLTTSNNTNYTTVGSVFKIGPSDARFNETITISIPYDATLAGQGGSEVRILQYTGSLWENVTTLPAADGRSVTGSIAVLGPVVAAIRSN